MEALFRDYKVDDYFQCEALVNQAWGFDKIFSPKDLADVAKCMYTKGSVLASNYRMVVEVDGKVAGFLFGFNEFSAKRRRSILFGLSILWRLFRIKTKNPQDKKDLVNAINTHEKNRSKVVGKGRSEIVLFVVGKNYQGLGYGKRLWSEFKDQCMTSGVNSIIVETNKLGASSFYEKIGFRHIGNFDSPMHEYAIKDGQACMYEYCCKKANK